MEDQRFSEVITKKNDRGIEVAVGRAGWTSGARGCRGQGLSAVCPSP